MNCERFCVILILFLGSFLDGFGSHQANASINATEDFLKNSSSMLERKMSTMSEISVSSSSSQQSGVPVHIFGGLPEESNNWSQSSLLVLILTAANLCCVMAMNWRGEIVWLRAVPEQIISIIVGMGIGLVTKLMDYDDMSDSILLNFSSIFFNFLLPSIIFSNAFSIKNKHFFRHLSGILLFSLVGSVISVVMTGYGIYFVFQNGIINPDSFTIKNVLIHVSDSGRMDTISVHEKHPDKTFMPLVDCMIMGSLFSAVDPGAVLSVLPGIIDRQIFGFLFGESVLNSAIAVLLYDSFRMYHHVLVLRGSMSATEPGDVELLLLRYVLVTIFSMLSGTIFGLLCAFTLRRVAHLRISPSREQAVLYLFAYLSYLFPQYLGLSPVVALFFCGATMTHYAYYNLSEFSQVATTSWFKTIGHVSETFVFVFLGASVFSVDIDQWHPQFTLVLLALCTVSRVVHIFFLSALINACRWSSSCWANRFRNVTLKGLRAISRKFGWSSQGSKVEEEKLFKESHRRHSAISPEYISLRSQIFLSLSGLRGAVAFALAIHAPVLNAESQMLSSTVSVILATYVLQGCCLRSLSQYLGLAESDEVNQAMASRKGYSFRFAHSPSDVLRLGVSPNVAACTYGGRSPSSQDETGSLLFEAIEARKRTVSEVSQPYRNNDEELDESESYGTFLNMLRAFDSQTLKPIFGGSKVSRSFRLDSNTGFDDLNTKNQSNDRNG